MTFLGTVNKAPVGDVIMSQIFCDFTLQTSLKLTYFKNMNKLNHESFLVLGYFRFASETFITEIPLLITLLWKTDQLTMTNI